MHDEPAPAENTVFGQDLEPAVEKSIFFIDSFFTPAHAFIMNIAMPVFVLWQRSKLIPVIIY
jgi:hypothetical protein